MSKGGDISSSSRDHTRQDDEQTNDTSTIKENITFLTPPIFYNTTQLSTEPTDELIKLHDHFKSAVLFHSSHEEEASTLPVGRQQFLPYNQQKAPPILLAPPTDQLSHCYLVTINPSINYQLMGLTSVQDEQGRSYQFSGFLLLSSVSLDHVPHMSLRQYNMDYMLSLKPHPFPTGSFVLQDVLLFMEYLFLNLLNLYDWFHAVDGQQKQTALIYFMPKFQHKEGNDVHISSMASVLKSFLSYFNPLSLTQPSSLSEEIKVSRFYSNSLIYNRTKKPSALRVDRINWNRGEAVIVHFSASLSHSSDNKEYTDKQSKYIDLHKQAGAGNLKRKEYFKLKQLRHELRDFKRNQSKREEVVELSCHGYHSTGVYTDMSQMALLCPLVTAHVSFHLSLSILESRLTYSFTEKSLLELALTHPSYVSQANVHSSNEFTVSSSNCGMRYCVSMTTQEAPPSAKRPRSGIEGLLDASQTDKWKENENNFYLPRDNERLEFLGDAVIEFLCSNQLYHMFPDLSDAHLVIFRKALICNQHLATVAKNLELDKYLLIKHCAELSGALDISRNLANALEAVIGSIYVDGGLEECRKSLALLLFPEEDLRSVWLRKFKDPLQKEKPNGDRDLIADTKVLQSFTKLEDKVGVTFSNIRLLARAFTHPSYGYTNLLLGDYQRMEFLGDAILQLVASSYVYDSFPLHHEGHLSAFRTAIVHNKQLAVVSNELGFPQYILFGKDQECITEKITADLVESFITALYLDKGMEYVQTFCQVCLFPKLASSAEGLRFLDAKTRLQHAVVYTCKREKTAIEAPVYRVLSVEGPSNNQIFTVGVYFRDRRIATGSGRNSQRAGMDAAEKALHTDHVMVPTCLKTRK